MKRSHPRHLGYTALGDHGTVKSDARVGSVTGSLANIEADVQICFAAGGD